jgi:RND family efflux transporter MFP subunit
MNDPRDRISDLRIERDELDLEPAPWPRRLALLAVAVLAVLLAAWWFLGRQRAELVRTAPVVTVAGDSTGVSVLDASGYVVARRQATVSSKVTGKIIEVSVEEGMRVTAGQVLARLDDAVPRRQLDLAEAQLASARSSLREIEVRRREAKLGLDRAEDLSRAGVSSQAALDAAQAEHDSQVARLEAERDRVAVAERQVALARQELEDTVIRSPFDGVAISKNAQPGEMISPVSAGGGFTRTGLSTIVDMSSLEIEVDVNEAFIQRVSPGQKVVAMLDAYPEWQIPAHVITTIPAADRQKATVRVRIGFDELGDPRLLPDMGVKVSFRAEESAEAEPMAPKLLVPVAAVRSQEGTEVVFVLRDGGVERRAVSLGGAAGDRREVLAGLRDGDRVVLDPPPTLEDGDPVREE